VLIADPDPIYAATVANTAHEALGEGCAVYTTHCTTTALRQVDDTHPDLVVLDVTLPPDGFQACLQIRRRTSAGILVVSARDAPTDKARALNLGADDYVTKPFDTLELLARLRALRRRARAGPGAPTPAEKIALSGLRIDCVLRQVRVDGRVVRLTKTEYRLLELLARHAGTVLPHELLLGRIWGSGYVGDTHCLKVFVRRLRRKLGDDAKRPRFIGMAWGVGYEALCLPPAPAPPTLTSSTAERRLWSTPWRSGPVQRRSSPLRWRQSRSKASRAGSAHTPSFRHVDL
jgi:DNA-binding response OmpR family regulator